MAEGPAGGQHGGSMDTGQDLLIQQEQPATPKGSRGVSSRGSSGEASQSLAATVAPAPGGKKPGYYSENGYLMELSRQERRRIQQEIKKRFKPGETWLSSNLLASSPPSPLPPPTLSSFSMFYAEGLVSKIMCVMYHIERPTSEQGAPKVDWSPRRFLLPSLACTPRSRKKVRKGLVWSNGLHFLVPTLNIECGQSDCKTAVT